MDKMAIFDSLKTVDFTEFLGDDNQRNDGRVKKDFISTQKTIDSVRKLFEEKKFKECLIEIDKMSDEASANVTFLKLKSLIHFATKDYVSAIPLLQTVLENDPKSIFALRHLGMCCLHLEKYHFLIDFMDQIIKLNAQDFVAFNLGGFGLLKQDKHLQALNYFTQALNINPKSAISLTNSALCLTILGRVPEAKEHLEKALNIKPQLLPAIVQLGNVELLYGNKDRAEELFIQASEIQPDELSAVWGRARAHKFTEQSEFLKYLKKASKKSKSHEIHYSLARSYKALNCPEKEFQTFQMANKLFVSTVNYNFDRQLAKSITMMNLFNNLNEEFSGFIGSKKVKQDGANLIFIVGMPRSGTSLVEQILAAHSQVHACGELEFLNKAVVESKANLGSHISQNLIDLIGKYYALHIDSMNVTGAYITDKMPLNFRHVGWIKLAFPKAKIINCQRDPMAVCVSNFLHFFPAPGLAFSCDLEEVGKYFNFYSSQMSFWRSRFNFYELNYEKLTENSIHEIQNLLKYVELAFEDSCLRSHTIDRPVVTASNEQVRSGIYQGSSKKWKTYEEFLDPLKQSLSDSSTSNLISKLFG